MALPLRDRQSIGAAHSGSCHPLWGLVTLPIDSHPLLWLSDSLLLSPLGSEAPCGRPTTQLLIPAILCLPGSCCLRGAEMQQYESVLTTPGEAPGALGRHQHSCPSGCAKGLEVKVRFHSLFRGGKKPRCEMLLLCSGLCGAAHSILSHRSTLRCICITREGLSARNRRHRGSLQAPCQ